MSKYGFNENELRKTVIDMIDKDGFHKTVTLYGNEASGHIEESGMKAGIDVWYANGLVYHDLGVANVPSYVYSDSPGGVGVESQARIALFAAPLDYDYVFNIDDALSEADPEIVARLFPSQGDDVIHAEFPKAQITTMSWRADYDSSVAGTEIAFQVYAIAVNGRILDRTKAIATMPVATSEEIQ